jgi:hypothetical protein
LILSIPFRLAEEGGWSIRLLGKLIGISRVNLLSPLRSLVQALSESQQLTTASLRIPWACKGERSNFTNINKPLSSGVCTTLLTFYKFLQQLSTSPIKRASAFSPFAINSFPPGTLGGMITNPFAPHKLGAQLDRWQPVLYATNPSGLD